MTSFQSLWRDSLILIGCRCLVRFGQVTMPLLQQLNNTQYWYKLIIGRLQIQRSDWLSYYRSIG